MKSLTIKSFFCLATLLSVSALCAVEINLNPYSTTPTIPPNLKKDNRGQDIRASASSAPGYRYVYEERAVNKGKFYRADDRKIMLFPLLDKIILKLRDDPSLTTETINHFPLNLPDNKKIHLEIQSSDGPWIFYTLKEKATFPEMEQLMTNLNSLKIHKKAGFVYINEETGKEVCLTGKLVVQLRSSQDKNALTTWAAENRFTLEKPMHGSDSQWILEFEEPLTDKILEICESLSQLDFVSWASPDFLFQLDLDFTPNDPLFNTQWHLHNTGQSSATADADIDAPEAWDISGVSPGGSSDIVVAIIDTGVETTHPDLSIFINQAEQNGQNNVDDDGNGYVDDINGWDFYSNDNNPNPATSQGHGTCCAGVASAAGHNSLGVASIAYRCKILPIKVTGNTGIFASSTALGNAIRYGADMANILSNSWGGGGDDSTIHSAIQYAVNTKGKPTFFASGNDADGTNADPCWIRWDINLGASSAGTRYFRWTYIKNVSQSSGEDSAWLEDILFPDGSTEKFEGGFPPTGWTTGGNANWIQYGESKHVRGTGSYSAKAGAITHSQTTYLQSPQKTMGNNAHIYFYLWIDCEYNYDYVQLLVENLGTANFNDAGTPIYDVGYPARYSECIAIGASTDFDYRSQYSQYDETLTNVLDIVAPSNGGNWGIATTDITGAGGYDSGDYTNASGASGFGGTSSACPLAAGTAAMILSCNQTLNSSLVKGILQRTADKIGGVTYTSGYNKYYGYGRVNAYRAIRSLTTVDAHSSPQPNLTLPSWNDSEPEKMSVLKFKITDHGEDSLPSLIDRLIVDISGTGGNAGTDIAWAELYDDSGAARVAIAASITNSLITFGSAPNSDNAAQLDSIADNSSIQYTVYIYLKAPLLAAHGSTYIFDIDETNIGVDAGNSSQMFGDTGAVTPVTGTIFIEALGITVTPNNWALGPVILSSVAESGSFSLQNSGNVAENFQIKGADGTGGWILSNTIGQDAFKADVDQDDNGSYDIVLTKINQLLFSNISVGGTKAIGLKYSAPSSDTKGKGVAQDFLITITASRYVP